MEKSIYTKGIALIIGINEYENATKLSKAVNDAQAIAQALSNLRFNVTTLIDASIDECDTAIEEFASSLNNFEVGVFYFAGHGVEIEGQNYLLVQNTPADRQSAVKRYSINLQDVVSNMHQSKCRTNILIIDACRDNPFPNTRGLGSLNLAPVFAPKGTIIAFSTSPGEVAKDGGMGNNSIYTGALIQHINEPGLPVEEFFKRVRTTVYTLSNQKQTSWEHTSLIGNFSFNSGQLIHSLKLPYSPEVIADKKFDCADPLIGEIVSKFRTYNYYTQNSALEAFESLSVDKLGSSQLFIVGRNILQAAAGGCEKCRRFIFDEDSLIKYTSNGSNHLLNGILFEMYFNSNGDYRYNKRKGFEILNVIIIYCKREKLRCSFTFIKNALFPFSERLIFIPTENPMSVSINVIADLVQIEANLPWIDRKSVV